MGIGQTAFRWATAAVLAWIAGFGAWSTGVRADEEPEAINPFGPVRQDRDDAVPGYLEMSDGQVYVGQIYMTRDKRLKIEDSLRQLGGTDGAPDDNTEKRQREIPLRAIRQIEAKVEKEWMEKEWRFKELALDEKYYTGRTYPARLYVHTITLKDGRTITGPVAEIFYVRPFRELKPGPRTTEEIEVLRFVIHKRDKGEPGTDLKSLKYVKRIKLGEDAVEEGRKKAAQASAPAKVAPATPPSGNSGKKVSGKKRR